MLTLIALRLRAWLASERRRDELRGLLGHDDRLLADAGVTRTEVADKLGRRSPGAAGGFGLLHDICRHSTRAMAFSGWR